MTASQISIETKAYQQVIRELYPWKTTQSDTIQNLPLSRELKDFLNSLATLDIPDKLTDELNNQLAAPKYAQLVSIYTTLVDIAKFIDRIYQVALPVQQTNLPLTSVIRQAKSAIFKLAIFDYRLFAKSNHVGNLFLNKLVALNETLSNDTSLINEIEIIVQTFIANMFSNDELIEINQAVETSYQELEIYTSIIEKKARILEKRSKELAKGRARAKHAKAWVEQEVTRITKGSELPKFILNFIEQSWSHVLFLKRLRNEELEDIEGLMTMRFLVICFNAVDNEVELEKLSSLHQHVYDSLSALLDKTNLGALESKSFLKGLLLSLGAVKKQSEEIIHKKNKEQIIRLKPQSRLAKTRSKASAPKPDYASMSMQEWASYKLTESPPSFPDLNNEISVPTNSTDKAIDHWAPGDWFDLTLENKNIRAKLVARFVNDDLFVFADYQGIKVLECNLREIHQRQQENQISRIAMPLNFENAIERTLNSANTERLKKKEAERLKKEREEKKEKKKIEVYKKLIAEANESIRGLSVGSWIEINETNPPQKCKLAARIRSTGKYIFTDRNGIKVMEPTREELAELLADNKINLNLKNRLFNQTFESIIDQSKRRD